VATKPDGLRGADTGPIGENFGAACNQIDHADLMLSDHRMALDRDAIFATPELARTGRCFEHTADGEIELE
jgi:hypothetical protein